MQDHRPGNREDIYKTILSQLLGPPTPSPRNPAERHFVLQALHLLFHINEQDAQLVALMIAYAVEDTEIQRLVLSHLVSQGVQDPYGYFPREILKLATEVGTSKTTCNLAGLARG